METAQAFEIWQIENPLPEGKSILLEASAGTGKTYQIAALYAKCIVELSVPIEKILCMTFTRAATGELKERIRKRLEEVRVAFTRRLERGELEGQSGDPFLEYITRGDDGLIGERLERVEKALIHFDRAFITTIHGFSQRMLERFAFESEIDPDLELLEGLEDLLLEEVQDALSWTYASFNAEELACLESLGFNEENLFRILNYSTGAVKPALRPEGPEGDAYLGPKEKAKAILAWIQEGLRLLDDMEKLWLLEAEGERLALQRKVEEKAFKGGRLSWLQSSSVNFSADLKARNLRKLLDPSHYKWLSLERLGPAYKKGEEALEAESFYPLLLAIQDFQEALLKWRLALSPFAVFTRGSRESIEAELSRRKLLSFDSMLSLLEEAISREGQDGPLQRGIREEFDVALVDEFQDTDASQWAVLKQVFQHPKKRLILIGDPKQAIYAFRGADVFVYLNAAKTVDLSYTMRKNWRSSEAYVKAMNAFWQEGKNAFLLSEGKHTKGIDYIEVTAKEAKSGLIHAPKVLLPLDGGLSKEGDFQGIECEERERRPFEIRMFPSTLGHWEGKGLHISSSEDALQGLAEDLALEALAFLGGSTRIQDGEESRPLRPQDMAVLVSSHRQAKTIQEALLARGLPAVCHSKESVFSSDAAHWVLDWLEALAFEGQELPAKRLALSPLIGFQLQDLGDALSLSSDFMLKKWKCFMQALPEWRDSFSRGFYVAFEHTLRDWDEKSRKLWEEMGGPEKTGPHEGPWERILSMENGERLATDLRHILEIIHEESESQAYGIKKLASFLEDEMVSAQDSKNPSENLALRLESDADAIQITTIHASKGLEYPIVFLPYLWQMGTARHQEPFLFHDEENPTVPILELRSDLDEERKESAMHFIREHAQDRRRLIYVALTRAKFHTVAWFGSAGQREGLPDGSYREALVKSEWGQLLLREDEGEALRASAENKKKELVHGQKLDESLWPSLMEALSALEKRSEGTMGWGIGFLQAERPEAKGQAGLQRGTRGSFLPERAEMGELAALSWPISRPYLESHEKVMSYTSLSGESTIQTEEPEKGLLPKELLGGKREAFLGAHLPKEPETEALLETLLEPSHLEGLHGGKDVGVWVHRLFEVADFRTQRGFLGEGLSELISESALYAGLSPEKEQQGRLEKAFPLFLESPLGSEHGPLQLPSEFSLSSLHDKDRLDEMRFDMRVKAPIEGQAKSQALPSLVKDAMALRGDEDWLGKEWLQGLLQKKENPFLMMKEGILVGAIDLTFRYGDGEEQRYYIADYKTNRILPQDRPEFSRRVHYTAPWMAYEMAKHAYHLQALIYTLALHRHLRSRLPNYDYDRHVGGHLYLFLRGMEGKDSPLVDGMPLGVFHDRWPKAVVLALDLALGG